MNRRTFTKKTLQTASLVGLMPSLPVFSAKNAFVRLGGPLFDTYQHPDEWIAALQKQGYRAAYCPLKTDASSDQIRAYAGAAKKADIVIAEVGAWSNPISPDPAMAQTAIKKCIDSLALAEAIGANCCVNISGSKNPAQWAGPHKNNLTTDTFDQIVEVTRRIINEVKPTRTFFTLELMPWSYPDSVEAYLRLLKAINLKQFAVHLDPMNIVVSPQVFYANGALIKECFKKLGPHIRSCHGKDIILKEDVYTPQLVECRPGLGQLDYSVFLTELSKLNNIPLMMEHLNTGEEYQKAAAYLRSVGSREKITL
ncbi:sugar phosphate isomerase/epimerase family protein [Spirosoma utsteinense]|uniref:Sugar phosphate isomerase/epimerase n=1 Tax=Spirosoma utsteinense TaxID=2585773 RepID=A0ABR6WCR4_9BACT|nr:sugar phosphate isomerase/epimerase [Spirosoma utsteinense]MBC3788590.1 sugar phosphate isomerase/epimerase [Spirosoma utsteinense]MBC3794089.1 sugar phosphate isomerase/epimerase [Spirosoma utsteinense]